MTIKEKFASGEYEILVYKYLEEQYRKVVSMDVMVAGVRYVAIHKKHSKILDAYLLDNDVEIEYKVNGMLGFNVKDTDFITFYDEDVEYRLKEAPLEYITIPNSDKAIKAIKAELLAKYYDVGRTCIFNYKKGSDGKKRLYRAMVKCYIEDKKDEK